MYDLEDGNATDAAHGAVARQLEAFRIGDTRLKQREWHPEFRKR
ncbi:Hypothetical protein A7982_03862 [Minicystis rosea]|nr:Hypothetical protein A7982_03862 [Minicystis rosea]